MKLCSSCRSGVLVAISLSAIAAISVRLLPVRDLQSREQLNESTDRFGFTTVRTTVSIPDCGTVLVSGSGVRMSPGMSEACVALMREVVPRLQLSEEDEASLLGNNQP